MIKLVDKLNMTLDEIATVEREERQAKREAERKEKAENAAKAKAGASQAGKKAELSSKKQTASNKEKPPLVTGTPVIVRNVEADVDLDSLKEIFSSAGVVKSCEKLQFNKRWHAARMVYKTKAEAEKAVEEFNNRTLDGKKLSVSLQKSRGESSAANEESNHKRQKMAGN